MALAFRGRELLERLPEEGSQLGAKPVAGVPRVEPRSPLERADQRAGSLEAIELTLRHVQGEAVEGASDRGRIALLVLLEVSSTFSALAFPRMPSITSSAPPSAAEGQPK
jgi:hypothetical protein